MDVKIKTWEEFKQIIYDKQLRLQYRDLGLNPPHYALWVHDAYDMYTIQLIKGSDPAVDFEQNYKSGANLPEVERNSDGREVIVSTSRPIWSTTYFTSSGDDFENGVIGSGPSFFFDFSNDDDIVPGAPSGFKRKQIDFHFIDPSWIKEGTIYFHKAHQGSFVDLFVVCPWKMYYLKNDGSYAMCQAVGGKPIQHFVNKLFIMGDCPMGDELNTESCSLEIPPEYIYRMWCTVPEDTSDCVAYANLEVYRERTCVLE